ncbi:hypothetical protein MNVI_07560 [Mycobacterium noviomagense]|uniref:Uncharacterized protein n=1 Tax=Mycobacterium noviomagense TaxID=459858 RepID=A0A7I7PA45_9MYCO|nr:hypothetical protein MNVI_07560 [Mycobacterium noviomagense]
MFGGTGKQLDLGQDGKLVRPRLLHRLAGVWQRYHVWHRVWPGCALATTGCGLGGAADVAAASTSIRAATVPTLLIHKRL